MSLVDILHEHAEGHMSTRKACREIRAFFASVLEGEYCEHHPDYGSDEPYNRAVSDCIKAVQGSLRSYGAQK